MVEEAIFIKNNNKKQELLNVAYKLFITKGYENTSVDEIIAQINMAKGTYYYYFKSKEQMLEEVINIMIAKEVEVAKQILNSNMAIENKIVGIINSMKPKDEEMKVKEIINKTENIIMHQKVNSKIIEETIPLLTEVVQEGIKTGIFQCENIEERIKLILIISNELLDDNATKETIEVFIDVTEKVLGAKKGTFDFIWKIVG